MKLKPRATWPGALTEEMAVKKQIGRGTARSVGSRFAPAPVKQEVPVSPLAALAERFQNIGQFAERLLSQVAETANRLTGVAAPDAADQKAEPRMGGIVGDLQASAENLERVMSGLERHAQRLSNDI